MSNGNFPKSIKASSKPDKFCPGCGHSIALKILGQVIDDLKISRETLIGVDIGCALLAWDFFDIPTLQTHHGRTVPVISGFKKADIQKVGIAYVGDGGAYAIGLQSLIHAANRNDPITVIVINNTLYGMTGGQMAPTTMPKEITATTPLGKNENLQGYSIKGPELFSCLENKKMYLARAMITQPDVVKIRIKAALEHQIKNHSFSMVEILSMCPTNWKKDAGNSINFVEKNMQEYYSCQEIKQK